MRRVRQFAKRVLPAFFLRRYQAWDGIRYAGRRLLKGGEPEARLLPVLCRSHKTSLDIGGNEGAYAVLMRRWSRRCVVFEPNIVLANRLRDGFLFDRRIAVRGEALSDHAGSAVLRIPMHEGEVVTGLASIDGDNRLGGLPFQSIEVARRRLDDLELRDIGFIKLDVEGHEFAVLSGGLALLRREQPTILVELSEHHRPNAVGSVADLLAPFGYLGLFLCDGRLHDLEDFDAAQHQQTEYLDALSRQHGGTYVGNFMFSVERDKLRLAIEPLLRGVQGSA